MQNEAKTTYIERKKANWLLIISKTFFVVLIYEFSKKSSPTDACF